MEITIDNCIDELNWIKITGVYPYGNTQDKLHTDDYIDTVIGILYRYQKIEGIVNTWHQDIYAKDFECIAEIADVVEEGNDDFVKEHKHE